MQKKYEEQRPKRCRKTKKPVQVDKSTQTDPQTDTPPDSPPDSKTKPVVHVGEESECMKWKAEAARYKRRAEWLESVRDWVSSNGRDSGLLEYLVHRGRVPTYLHWNGEPIK